MKKTVILVTAGAALFAGGYWLGTSRSGAPDEKRKESIAGAIAARSGAGASPEGRAAAEKEVRTFAPGKPFAKGQAKEWLLALAASLGGDDPDRGNEMAFVEAVQIFLTMDEASALEVGETLKELLMAYEAGDPALKAIKEGDDLAGIGLMLTTIRLAQINPAIALTMLEGMPKGMPNEAMRVVFGRLATQDPARAEQMALTLPEQQRRGALEGIMYSMGHKDPAAALELAARYPQEISSHDRNRLLEQWARRDPPAAMGGAVKITEQSGDTGALREVFGEFLKKDSNAAAQWAATHSGPGATTMQAMLLERRAHDEPQAVMAEYAALQQRATDQRELRPLATAIADRLTDTDTGAAREWAMSLPDGEAKNGAIYEVAETWVRQDAPAASEWIRGLPPGDGRDGAITQLTEAIRHRDPAAAFEWALSIQNENRRTQETTEVFRQWRQQDPDAAKASLESLPPEVKKRMESSPDFFDP